MHLAAVVLAAVCATIVAGDAQTAYCCSSGEQQFGTTGQCSASAARPYVAGLVCRRMHGVCCLR